MKNLVLSVCGIAVATALITPKIVSNQVESQLHTIASEINAAYGYNASVSSLQSNWFNTSGKIKITMDAEAFATQDSMTTAPEDLYLEFDIQANHGPILTEGENTFGLLNMSVTLTHDKLREYIKWSEKSPFYGATVYTNLFGNTSYKDAIQAFTITDAENDVDVEFEGYQGEGTFSNGTLSYHGSSVPSHVSVDKVNVEIGEIKMSMVANASFADLLQTGLYDSESKFTISSFNIRDDAKDVNAKLDNIYIEAISKIDEVKKAANIAVTYGVGAVKAKDFNATDIALALEVNNISKDFVKAYQENAEIFTQGSAEEIGANIERFAQDNLLSLLAAEPQINITSLRATLEDGTFESNLNTSVVGITQLPAVMQDPSFWLQHFLANGEIKGSKAVIERIAAVVMESQIKADPEAADMTQEQIKQIAAQQAPQFLQTFVQQGLIIENQSGYQTNFVFKNKALTVNDNPIPLPI